MKKIFLFLFLLIPNLVNASDLVINDLNITNGILSLPFDPLNTEYTVTLEEIEYNLDLYYKVDNETTVSVLDNHDLENNSLVTVTISKDDKKLDYHFHILKKENAVNVFNEINEDVINDSFMFKYKAIVIPSISLLLIIIIHKIIFRKHKKKII